MEMTKNIWILFWKSAQLSKYLSFQKIWMKWFLMIIKSLVKTIFAIKHKMQNFLMMLSVKIFPKIVKRKFVFTFMNSHLVLLFK